MSQIRVSHLTFCYDGSYDNVFEDVSFVMDTSWRLGFCGRNGRGKTTFLKLLMGEYDYSGEIVSSVGFEYFPYPVADASRSVLEILQQIAPQAEQWEIECELSLLELREDIPSRAFSTLSHGEQTKALLAALFLKENRFLLIDEPTNHLDMQARETVARYLCGKSGFILVSHDRSFLDDCTDHILSINRAEIEIQSGNFSSWYHNKELQDAFELEKNDKLKKEIKRLSAAARQNADWSDKVEASKIGGHSGDRGRIGHLAAKMMKRSKSVETRRNREIEEKSTLLKNIETADSLKLSPLVYHSKRLLSAQELSLFYGETQVCQNVNFTLEQGERIALCGRNGSGKSSILRLLCAPQNCVNRAENPKAQSENEFGYHGALLCGSQLRISHLPQDASFLRGALNDFIAENALEESLFKAILRKLDFSRVQFEKDMADYSAGQKKKVLIAKSLCEKAHVYVWDEPLNYIDVLSRMQIEELLLQFVPTLLFVEHDRAFCAHIATKTVSLC